MFRHLWWRAAAREQCHGEEAFMSCKKKKWTFTANRNEVLILLKVKGSLSRFMLSASSPGLQVVTILLNFNRNYL